MNGKEHGNELSTNSPDPAITLKAERLTRKKTIDQLFSKLAALYGNKFSDLWAGQDLTAVKATWADAIGVLTDAELRAGVNVLIVGGKIFPPTLPEFYAACRPPLALPSVADHKALDVLAARLGIATAGFRSYEDLRFRLKTAIAEGERELPAPDRLPVSALPSRVAL